MSDSLPPPPELDPVYAAETRQPLFYGITFALLICSLAVVSLRFYCRAVLIRKIGLDDWLILVGLILAWVLGVLNYFHVSHGTGKHIETITFDALIPTLKHWYAYQLIYPIVLCIIKLSILSFYKGISPQKPYQIAIWSTIGLVLAYTIAIEFVYMFECPKPSMSWSVTFPTGCMNLSVLYYTSASINILTDILILCLPIPVLMTIQIQKRKRIALVGIFFIGFIAVLASVSRIWALWLYQNTKDVSYDAIFILLFSNIEINLAIITASAPPLRPLFKGVFKSSSYGHSYGYPTRSNDGWTGRSRSDGGVQLSRLGVNDDTRRQTKIRGGKEGHTRNESEEEIVAKDSNGIVRTRDINVTITNQQSTESLPV
ncbi:hypothetical protein TWF192_005361 [Orbilia oligospora]|uniref:Rhodopsin domain-containing protein n=1 Tax=Orbilia oligospora TaxID=2813651 RepID=A0A6G1MAB0_ORBOL|nr:hypothetical protein TWF679_002128 [Orbilia oligospora]KAF3230751.1 hypothetical protein TWF191_008595 [Orbilia oligospora]KAF3250341.1 hypothetical protein TWF192_005361 [Orbilia oligospora]